MFTIQNILLCILLYKQVKLISQTKHVGGNTTSEKRCPFSRDWQLIDKSDVSLVAYTRLVKVAWSPDVIKTLAFLLAYYSENRININVLFFFQQHLKKHNETWLYVSHYK